MPLNAELQEVFNKIRKPSRYQTPVELTEREIAMCFNATLETDYMLDIYAEEDE